LERKEGKNKSWRKDQHFRGRKRKGKTASVRIAQITGEKRGQGLDQEGEKGKCFSAHKRKESVHAILNQGGRGGVITTAEEEGGANPQRR